MHVWSLSQNINVVDTILFFSMSSIYNFFLKIIALCWNSLFNKFKQSFTIYIETVQYMQNNLSKSFLASLKERMPFDI